MVTRAGELSGRRFDLVGIGECMVEFWADAPLGSAGCLHRSFGGDVLNALVTAARLGSKVGFISKVGNDPFGPGLLEAWQKEGIDTSHAPLVAGENGIYFISLLEGGEREFTYRRTGSSASTLSSNDLDETYLASSRTLLLSGITQAISPSARAATLGAADLAKRHGVRVAYDPNYRPKLWDVHGGIGAAQEAFWELVPKVDLLLPSYPADVELLTGAVLEAEEALRRFAEVLPDVAMKAGAHGAWLGVNGTWIHHPAAPAERVLDTTGAGDAWNGALLSFLGQDVEPAVAVSLANLVAAAKLAYRGAVPAGASFDFRECLDNENVEGTRRLKGTR